MKEKVAEFIQIFFGFRKFILMILLFGVGIIFRLHNYVDGGQFVDLMKNTTIAFFAANGFEYISSTIKEYVNSQGQKVAEVDTSTGTNTAPGTPS